MSMPRYLRVIRETAFGQTPENPSAEDVAYLRLDQANAFTVRRKPITVDLPGLELGNLLVRRISARHEVTGRLSTLLDHARAALLLDWAAGLADGEIPSFTCDYFDGLRRRRYLGVKVERLTITSAAESQVVRLNFDLRGMSTAEVDPTAEQFPAPSMSDLPVGTLYVHEDLADGGLVLGAVRGEFRRVVVEITNRLPPRWDELPHVSRLPFHGRRIRLNAELYHKSTTDIAALEEQTPRAGAVVWTRGSSSVALDFHGQCVLDRLIDDEPLDDDSYQNAESTVLYSGGGVDSDLTITVTP